MSFEKTGHQEHYNSEYARKYVERTLASPYTIYKNQALASVTKDIGAPNVLDLGCNVSPIIKRQGSLRFQMEQQGIKYAGLDLSFPYFDKGLAQDLNVIGDETYGKVIGVVGDMMNIPIKDASISLVTCADVLEHVPNPDTAFEEISRILSEDGRALIVLPSMYKLDIADYEHIEERRKSSHESKLTASDWENKWEKAGLEIDYEKSRPLGIASGLSYLSWLVDDYVPERNNIDGEETYSEKSKLHKKAKQILSQYDQNIDDIIMADENIKSFIIQALKSGEIEKVFTKLKEITDMLEISDSDLQSLHNFFDSVSGIHIQDDRVVKLNKIFQDHDNPLFLIGNSMLAVLKKK